MIQPDNRRPSDDGVLAAGWSALLEAVDVSRRAPLSARHALHAAVMIDRVSDLAFVRRAQLFLPVLATAGDILSFRAAVRSCNSALGPLMDLTACRADGPCLLVAQEEVARDGFASLPVADLMVSLYSAGTVPRLVLARPGATLLPMQVLLLEATEWWSLALGTWANAHVQQADGASRCLCIG